MPNTSCSKNPAGSSPRGRGTLLVVILLGLMLRFIPARAGNARRSQRWIGHKAVHPRAGGERADSAGQTIHKAGSSPRGRGTPRNSYITCDGRRFIPARAGNASPGRCLCGPAAVHPRAGGERLISKCLRPIRVGSSPRGRGTRARINERATAGRFIPARAGNAFFDLATGKSFAVHPRAGGERAGCRAIRWPGIGSSPRGRGTQSVRTSRPSQKRFIPARAGNAQTLDSPADLGPVHPRAGGERLDARIENAEISGSSPRGRGTRLVG